MNGVQEGKSRAVNGVIATAVQKISSSAATIEEYRHLLTVAYFRTAQHVIPSPIPTNSPTD